MTERWVITLTGGDSFQENAESVVVMPSGALRIVTRPGHDLLTRYINEHAWAEASQQQRLR